MNLVKNSTKVSCNCLFLESSLLSVALSVFASNFIIHHYRFQSLLSYRFTGFRPLFISKMAESSDSISLDKESVNTTANNKREAHSDSSDFVTKKLRSSDTQEEPKAEITVPKNGTELYFEIEADAAEDKGSRHTMEDASVVLPDAGLEFPGKLRCAHFAIYDGHGGRLAAEYARKHVHANVLSAGLSRELLDVKAAKNSIVEGFRRTDESLLQESTKGCWQDGATAVCVWVLGSKVFVANIGDAKAILARSSPTDGSNNTSDGSTPIKAIVLTREHKAIYPQERARIQKAGGSVSSNGRLQARLEVSRAFGDRQFKKVFGPSDAVHFVQKLLKEGLPVKAVSRSLVREAVRERQCKDNCSAVVIAFRKKQ
ncbi:probable protein phosphatase 2C 8 isoform X2 [Solanum dulcamara]|uniref:probable protein phosphatase 2C 8 isoform X2 n=1 Tax=Solanum dulcamara TaxID=45834 RepID=UPI0024867FEF|nr:probable protein phosphatase 2C 8 isoform X2 [Solanum dulcamara]